MKGLFKNKIICALFASAALICSSCTLDKLGIFSSNSNPGLSKQEGNVYEDANIVLESYSAKKRINTMHDAVVILKEAGYEITDLLKVRGNREYFYYLNENKIVALQNNEVVWPAGLKDIKKVDLWKLATNIDNLKDGYSHYLIDIKDSPQVFSTANDLGFVPAEDYYLDFTGGIDSGYMMRDWQDERIIYLRYKTNLSEEIVINTSDHFFLTIDAPNSVISHYGNCVCLFAFDGQIIEHGTVLMTDFSGGFLVIDRGAKVALIEILVSEAQFCLGINSSVKPPLFYYYSENTYKYEIFDDDYNAIKNETICRFQSLEDAMEIAILNEYPREKAKQIGLYMFYIIYDGNILNAKHSNDQSKVRSLNIGLKAYLLEDHQINTKDDLMTFIEDWFDSSYLEMVTEDYILAYLLTEQVFVIIENNQIVFPIEYCGSTQGLDFWYL